MVIREGFPHPLGATWDGLGVNFALFSAHATKVELCLFDDSGARELERIELPEFTDEVWHGYLPQARPGTVYAYRVHGPFAPRAGHRFNANKLLLDPYAKAHVGAFRASPEIYGYAVGEDDDLGFDARDSAPFMPKCRVIDPAFTWGRDLPPRVPWERTIIYETHVRGFTKLHEGVPLARRGTYAGLAEPEVVQHIRGLGVTSVELMPTHTFMDDDFLLAQGLSNFWGYNTIGFFAPDPRYAAKPERAVSEFKEMVARLHDAGLEVILDVVYNHTAEGNERGPTLSFRGIDNASYYRLAPDPRYYINDTGTGNTLNISHPRVLQMVTDSLRYWVQEMHVDGFRFDLCTILARETHGFDEGGGFLDSCRQDPVLSAVKLIAEPWDVGPGGYQVGGFPPGWAEWNDRFRDTARGFWKGEVPPADMSKRLCASGDMFNRRGRKPWASVNFVTAHDGYTLADVVSFNDKHNQANGENNLDGTSHNNSWNCGVEGPTTDPDILALRQRQVRNMLATLLFSQGTPMLLAGDEIGRTQRGNNNAYCQDNRISWVDWRIPPEGHALYAFVQRLVALRDRYPVLSRKRFLTGHYNEELGVKDVSWIHPNGNEMRQRDWNDPSLRAFGMMMDGRAQATGIRRLGSDVTLLLLLNAHPDPIDFVLPEAAGGLYWRTLVDTAEPEAEAAGFLEFGMARTLADHSLALLQLEA